MPNNILQTHHRLLQNAIAPDARELNMRLTSLEKPVDKPFRSLEHRSEARFQAAMGASKAQA